MVKFMTSGFLVSGKTFEMVMKCLIHVEVATWVTYSASAVAVCLHGQFVLERKYKQPTLPCLQYASLFDMSIKKSFPTNSFFHKLDVQAERHTDSTLFLLSRYNSSLICIQYLSWSLWSTQRLFYKRQVRGVTSCESYIFHQIGLICLYFPCLFSSHAIELGWPLQSA